MSHPADLAQAIAPVDRKMVDVIDAGEQHRVKGRLEEILSRLKFGVGHDFVGVKELNVRLLLEGFDDPINSEGRESVVVVDEGDPFSSRHRERGIGRRGNAFIGGAPEDC